MQQSKHIYFWLGLSFVWGAGLWACKPVSTSSKQKIVNGQTVAPGSPVLASTVGLVLVQGDGSKGKVFCTGVIISADAILTATQCLESLQDAGSPKWGILLENRTLLTSQILAVKETQNFSPAGARDYPSLNLSLVRSTVPIDPALGYAPAEILRSPTGLQPATEVLIAGYGRKNSKCLSAATCDGVLLEAKSSVESFHDQNHLLSTLLVQANQGQGSLCFGDAGGPAFVQINGQYFLAGIASGSIRRGLSELSATSNDSLICENGLAAFSFTGDYLNWLNTTLGLKLADPSPGNLARSTNPALELTSPIGKPSNLANWGEWLAFNNYQDPAFGAVSFLQQRLIAAQLSLKDGTKFSELDYYTKPQELEQKVPTVTDLALVLARADGKALPSSRQLSNLEPLAAFTGLTKLDIDGMMIQDFSPLGSLSNLSSLRIVRNGDQNASPRPALSKLDVLSNLTQLQTLELNQVGIETLRDIDASRLTSLKTLTIDGLGQPIFIPKAPLLDTLIIRNADLSNPTTLTGLPASLVNLSITGSKLSTVAFVTNLVNLRTLDLSGNQISDFTRVGDLKKLTSVKASGNPAASKICGTPAALVCEYDQITNPVTMEEFCINFVYQPAAADRYRAAFLGLTQSLKTATVAAPNLPVNGADCADLFSKLRLKRKLEIVGNGNAGALIDLAPIAAIKSLNNLAIKNFGIIDVKPLSTLLNLDVLDLSNNLIIDPKPLEALPELINLNLSGNLISDMNNFSNPLLRRLVLDGNRLVSAQSLGLMPELQSLSLANQPGFKDVKAVGRLGKLKKLNIGKTDVTDLQTLGPIIGLEIDAPEAAVKTGCPVLLGSCVTGEGTTLMSISGPVPGMKPGQKVQNNPAQAVDLPGLSMAIKLQ